MLFGKEHVRRYIETGGKVGHDWMRGAPVLLLTTTGRRTGDKHTTPLIYQPHGDAYLVVASNGGSKAPPSWYRNLQADPEVGVQVWDERFGARARTATAAEKPELWRMMLTVWPDYDGYQQRTRRDIAVVVLERA